MMRNISAKQEESLLTSDHGLQCLCCFDFIHNCIMFLTAPHLYRSGRLMDELFSYLYNSVGHNFDNSVLYAVKLLLFLKNKSQSHQT